MDNKLTTKRSSSPPRALPLLLCNSMVITAIFWRFYFQSSVFIWVYGFVSWNRSDLSLRDLKASHPLTQPVVRFSVCFMLRRWESCDLAVSCSCLVRAPQPPSLIKTLKRGNKSQRTLSPFTQATPQQRWKRSTQLSSGHLCTVFVTPLPF